ncbi:MAG: hypothetical protein AMXMBFR33_71950 [Candidatus Xenobia bacterium]
MHYLLFYEKVEDYQTRQQPFSQAHREHIAGYVRAGTLLLGGNLGPAGALILFHCDGPELVERFAATDPYVLEGVVARWRVEPWDTVVGTAL